MGRRSLAEHGHANADWKHRPLLGSDAGGVVAAGRVLEGQGREGEPTSTRLWNGMVHSESSKRKFEEELAMDDMFSFSDMLNSTTTTGSAKKQRNSASGSFSALPRRRQQEPITEDMDQELTVRGQLHWVGVMKEWEWESMLILHLRYVLRQQHPRDLGPKC